MSDKCEYIVSNTISIDPTMASIVINDLNKRHGKYTYQYPRDISASVGYIFLLDTEINIAIQGGE